MKDPNSKACAIVDSVMDIDYAAGRITFDHADEMIRFVKDNGEPLAVCEYVERGLNRMPEF